MTPIYKIQRTLERPPQTVRLPLNMPLSRFIGATPTNAAICLLFNTPSSGKPANNVAESTGPTPGVLCKILSFSRHTGLFLRSLFISLFTLCRHFSSQSIWLLMSPRVQDGAISKRFFSAVNISTIWRRLVFRASRFCASTFFSARTSGRTASAKWASTWASIESVFASFPVALAKSLTCFGFTTTTGHSRAANAPTTPVSKPPVASRTTNDGELDRTKSTRCAIPSSSFEKTDRFPVGRNATSNSLLQTSIPINTCCFTSFMSHTPYSLPCNIRDLVESLATVRVHSEMVMATLAHSRNQFFQDVIGLPQPQQSTQRTLYYKELLI